MQFKKHNNISLYAFAPVVVPVQKTLHMKKSLCYNLWSMCVVRRWRYVEATWLLAKKVLMLKCWMNDNDDAPNKLVLHTLLLYPHVILLFPLPHGIILWKAKSSFFPSLVHIAMIIITMINMITIIILSYHVWLYGLNFSRGFSCPTIQKANTSTTSRRFSTRLLSDLTFCAKPAIREGFPFCHSLSVLSGESIQQHLWSAKKRHYFFHYANAMPSSSYQ